MGPIAFITCVHCKNVTACASTMEYNNSVFEPTVEHVIKEAKNYGLNCPFCKTLLLGEDIEMGVLLYKIQEAAAMV